MYLFVCLRVSEHSQKRVVALKTEACRVKDLYHFIITDCGSPLREAHDLIEEHLAKCGAPGTAWEKVCKYGGSDVKICNNFILLQIFFILNCNMIISIGSITSSTFVLIL